MGVNERWVCGVSSQLLYMLLDYCEMSSVSLGVLISTDASAYTQVTGMTEWALRCQECTIAAYMREHLAITNVNMCAFYFIHS